MANEPNKPNHPFYQTKHNRPNPRISETQYFIDPTLIPGNTIPPLVPGYTPNVVNNNGTGHLLGIAGQIASSVQFEMSLWFRFNDPIADLTEQMYMSVVDGGTNNLRVRRRSDNSNDSRFQAVGGGAIYTGLDTIPLVADTLYHLYMHGGADLGPELVQNGTGLVDTSFWVPKNAILAAVGGNLEISDNGQFSVGYQGVPTETGATYLHTFTTKVGSTATQVGYGNGNNPPFDNEYANNEQPRDTTPVYPKTYQYLFTASANLTYISAGPDTPETLLIGEHSLKKILGDVDDYGGVSLLNGLPFMADGIFDPIGLFSLQGNIGLLSYELGGSIMNAVVFDWYFNSKQIRGYDAFQRNGVPIDISAYTDADVLMIGDAADWNAVNNAGSIALTSGGAGFTDISLVPDAFTSPDWRLANDGTVGELFIDTLIIPGSAGAPVTDTLYSLDGGPLVSMRSTTPTRTIVRGLIPGEIYVVRVYAENAIGVSDVSDTKQLEAAIGNRVPFSFGPSDWTVVDNLNDGELLVDVLSLPDDGGQPISSIEYQVDSTGWFSSGLTQLGSFVISGLTNDVDVNVVLRAVNSIGAGDQGVSKSVTPTDPSEYTPNIVDNNATAILRAVELQIVDSPTFEISMWVKVPVVPAISYTLIQSTDNRLRIRMLAAGTIIIQFFDDTDTAVWNIATIDPVAIGSFIHIYTAIDLNTPSAILRIDGVEVPLQENTPIIAGSGTLNLSNALGIWSTSTSGNRFNGQFFDVYADSKQIRGYDAFQKNGDPVDISAFIDADILLTGNAAAWEAADNEGVILLFLGAGGFTDVAGYTPNIVNNNGVGWLQHVSGQIPNGPIIEISYWLRLSGPVVTAITYQQQNGGNDVRLRNNVAGSVSITLLSSNGSGVLVAATDNIMVTDELVHIYISLDIETGAGTYVVLGNGVDILPSASINVQNRILSVANAGSIMDGIGGVIVDGEMFDFYLNTNQIRGYDAFQEVGEPRDISSYTDADILLTGNAAAWNAATNEGVINLTSGATGFTDIVPPNEVPDAFLPSDWLLTDVGDGDALLIAVSSLPVDNGNAITDIEYEIDDDNNWITTGLSTVGQFDITGLTTDVEISVRIRAVNVIGPSLASDAKIDIPTIGSDWTINDLLPNAAHRTKRTAMVDAHFAGGHEGNWSGFTPGELAGFDTVTATSAADLVDKITAVGLNGTTIIECEWNGISSTSNRSFGPAVGSLTPDGSVDWGYERPGWSVMVRPKAGFAPQIRGTNGSLTLWETIGLSKIEYNDMIFEEGALKMTSNSSYPLYQMVAYKGCTFQNWQNTEGLGHHTVQTAHYENCHVFNCRIAWGGSPHYLRVWDCTVRQQNDIDIFGMRSYNQGVKANWTAHIWIAGMISYDMNRDQWVGSAFHSDWIQTTTTGDLHNGYSLLVEMNMIHQNRDGSQAMFSELKSGLTNDYLIHNNCIAHANNHSLTVTDSDDDSDKVVTKNMCLRNATPTNNDNNPWIRGWRNSTGTGSLEVSDNYCAEFNTGRVNGESFTGNELLDPRLGAPIPIKYETILTSTTFYAQGGTGFVQYDSPDEGEANAALAFIALRNAWTPGNGWGIDAGPEDPDRWPTGDYSSL